MCIAYDPSRKALLQPGLRPTVFKAGDAERLSIDAICAECSRLVYLRFESSAAHRALLLEALARLDAVDWGGSMILRPVRGGMLRCCPWAATHWSSSGGLNRIAFRTWAQT
jgi:hypothetical protein